MKGIKYHPLWSSKLATDLGEYFCARERAIWWRRFSMAGIFPFCLSCVQRRLNKCQSFLNLRTCLFGTIPPGKSWRLFAASKSSLLPTIFLAFSFPAFSSFPSPFNEHDWLRSKPEWNYLPVLCFLYWCRLDSHPDGFKHLITLVADCEVSLFHVRSNIKKTSIPVFLYLSLPQYLVVCSASFPQALFLLQPCWGRADPWLGRRHGFVWPRFFDIKSRSQFSSYVQVSHDSPA